MKTSTIVSVASLLTAPLSLVSGAAIAMPEPDHEQSVSIVARDDGFKWTCPQIWLNDQFRSLLFAYCYDFNGKLQGTQIDMNRCLGNNDGNLVAQPNGGLWGSCDKQSCSVSSAVFRCNCKKYGGEWVNSALDLNPIMGNNNGMLTCFGLSGI